MTDEEKVDAFRMKLNQQSYRAIADKYGVSQQYIQQMLSNVLHVERGRKNHYKYPVISKWLVENGKSPATFAKDLDISRQTAYLILEGKANPSMKIISKILSLTGMTYEEAFSTEKEETK